MYISVVLRGIPQNLLWGLLKHRSLGPTPRVSDLAAVEQAPEFVFLTSSQVVMMLLFRKHTLRTAGLDHLLHRLACL